MMNPKEYAELLEFINNTNFNHGSITSVSSTYNPKCNEIWAVTLSVKIKHIQKADKGMGFSIQDETKMCSFIYPNCTVEAIKDFLNELS